jgi:hypothetical protein
MREWYLLIENQEIICIFDSLMDILSWTPPRQITDPIIIHRVYEEAGIFLTQKIQVNSIIYNRRL